MKVKQFRYSHDNLAYLVYGPETAIAIDAGAVNEMIDFAEKNGLNIKYVTNTHSHHDHTSGNELMLKKTTAKFLDCKKICGKEHIEIDNEKLLIFRTPGHIDDCLTFKADNILITGDTLFNGTIGNCFSGDLESFFNSIKFLISFPKETIVYGGHDYVKEAMAYAKIIEPENSSIEKYLENYNSDHIISTLEDELNANTYVRFNEKSMINKLKEKGVPSETELQRFESIYELY